MAEALRVEGLSRSFGSHSLAVNQVDLALEPGTFFCLLGPSGCGKTTLLRLIGGYLAPDAGKVFVAGRDVTHLPLEKRDIGMVFQNYALFPHLSARKNVAFGLEARKIPHSERSSRVEAMLDRVGLVAAERERRPRELSGGQQQRIALARALVIEPKLLLLDEPLAHLDRQLREQLRAELKDLQRRTGVTTLFVTHDQEEALSLSDRVGLMLGGRLLQVDSPQDLYERPQTPFVARFVGQANLLEIMDVEAEVLHLRDGLTLRCPSAGRAVRGGWLMIRPQNIVVGSAALQCLNSWTGKITGSTFLGADQLLEMELSAGLVLRMRCRPGEVAPHIQAGQLTVGVAPEAIWIIPNPDPDWLSQGKEADHALS